jgi:membrane protein
VLATAAGVLIMLYFASAVFHELGAALDKIWDVPPRGGLGGLLLQRLVALVLGPAAVAAGLLTMAVAFLHALVAPIVSDLLPAGVYTWTLGRTLIPFLLTALLLCFLYRYGTRGAKRWSDVGLAAFLVALTFSVGNAILAGMLRKSLLASLYGYAGAFVLLLLWIFYSTHLVLIGACFAREYADRFGSRVTRASGSRA